MHLTQIKILNSPILQRTSAHLLVWYSHTANYIVYMTFKINLSQMVIKITYECKYDRGFLQIHEMYLHVCVSSLVLQFYLQFYSILKQYVEQFSTLKTDEKKIWQNISEGLRSGKY
jgi:hypothetical protein